MLPLEYIYTFTIANIFFLLIHWVSETVFNSLYPSIRQKLNPDEQKQYHLQAEVPSRVASTLHALAVGSGCMYLLITCPEFRADAYSGTKVPDMLYHLLIISIAYFIQDTRLILKTKLEPYTPMLIHHFVSLLAVGLALVYPKSLFYAMVMFITECATPIHNGWFFVSLWERLRFPLGDRSGEQWKKLVGYIYLLSWLIFRTAGVNLYVFYRWYVDWEEGNAALPFWFKLITMPTILLLMGGNTRYLFESDLGPFHDIVFWKTRHDSPKKVE